MEQNRSLLRPLPAGARSAASPVRLALLAFHTLRGPYCPDFPGMLRHPATTPGSGPNECGSGVHVDAPPGPEGGIARGAALGARAGS